MALEIVITDAGRAAVINAENTGTDPIEIVSIGFTESAFVPNASMTSLTGQFKTITAIGGQVVADDTIHVTATDTSADEYTLHGFGLYLDGGTLFAIYSQADPILEKVADSVALLANDIIFTDISATSITVGDASFNNPPASDTVAGVVQFMGTQTDETINRVMRRGAWGLGGWLAVSDANSATRSGFYALPEALGATNAPLGGVSGALEVIEGGADEGYIVQKWWQSNDIDQDRGYTRRRNSAGTWSPWRLIGALTGLEVLLGGGQVALGYRYYLGDDDTYTLPEVTGLNVGDSIVFVKPISGEPTIEVDGSESEEIELEESPNDTAVIFDINSEITFTFNGTNWEV